MKANHWDLVKAIPLSYVLGQLPEIISNTMKAMGEAASTARDFVSQFAQAINESLSKIDSK